MLCIRYTKSIMKILTAFKHLFIPHEHNDYKPHFFRELSVFILFTASIFALGASFGSYFFIHRTVLGAEIASAVLIDLTNEDRIAANQPALLRSPKLDNAAQLKGEDMASKQYFSHDSPEGVTPWFWFRKVGYNFLYAGENLAINFTDSSEVEKAWLNSPTHRANIMNVEFREIGMATVQGVYNDYPTIYIVQMFGTPAYGKTTKETTVTKEVTKKEIPAENIAVLDTGSSSTVKGDSVQKLDVATTSLETVATTTDKATESVAEIMNTQEMIVVKNTEVLGEEIKNNEHVPFYSKWYQRFIFNAPYYVETLYIILLILITVALITMIVVEIKKQHYLHILYGVMLLAVLIIFMYINKGFY